MLLDNNSISWVYFCFALNGCIDAPTCYLSLLHRQGPRLFLYIQRHPTSRVLLLCTVHSDLESIVYTKNCIHSVFSLCLSASRFASDFHVLPLIVIFFVYSSYTFSNNRADDLYLVLEPFLSRSAETCDSIWHAKFSRFYLSYRIFAFLKTFLNENVDQNRNHNSKLNNFFIA